LKDGASAAIFSRFTGTRTPSSVSNTLPSASVSGAISRVKRPSAIARPARSACYPNDAMDSPVGSSSLPEVIFLVEEAPEGGFTARALGESIFTEANDLADDLHAKVRDAVRCHFDEGKAPKVIRLHFIREEVIKV
jgi:hypothetical protein